MPRDCPHNRCSFFLPSPTALCPACGRRVDSFTKAWLIWPLGALVAVSLLLLPVRSSLVAGIAIVSVAAVAVGMASRPPRATSPITTLEDRYQRAVDDTQHWLRKWGELFSMRAEVERTEDERLLLDEALAAADGAAAEAVARRNRYARRFITNGFERLDQLVAAALPVSASPPASTEIANAVAVIERYLDTLWVDDRIATQARNRLRSIRPAQQRGRVLQLAGSVRLFEPVHNGVAGSDLESQRFRLNAERRLLKEAPWSDAGLFED